MAPRRAHRSLHPVRLAVAGLAATTSSGVGCGESDVAPGPEESCSDGVVRPCYPGDPSTRGVGTCRDGEQQCVGTSWSDCLGFLAPAEEACGNDGDDDCNGAIDDGCSCEAGQGPRACYGGPAITRGIGECHDGLQPCVDGHWSAECDGEALPGVESCDELDNDCTGIVDEGCACTDGANQPCYGGPASMAGVGECKLGTQLCASGAWSASCSGQILPSTESCNGKDDDCDGTADDGDPGGGTSCDTGLAGVCAAGTRHCVSGASLCQQNAYPTSEICDGVDQNCNGLLDDGSFLPPSYGSIEYVPSGWAGLPEGVMVTWGSHLAFWDFQAAAVIGVMTLTEAWQAISPAGNLPPGSGITSLLALPASFTGGADTAVVASGASAHMAELGDPSGWHATTISALLGVPGLVDAQAATVFYAGEIAPTITIPLLLVVDSAQQVWVIGSDQPLELSVAELFCSPGSSNCPVSVEALARVPGSPSAWVLVQSGGVTYSSQFHFDNNGALYFTWSSMSLGAVSCAH